jgi:hypothetical protein
MRATDIKRERYEIFVGGFAADKTHGGNAAPSEARPFGQATAGNNQNKP